MSEAILRPDLSLEVDLPVESEVELFLFENLLHCDSVEKVQKCVKSFREYRSVIKELADSFEMPYVRAALESSWADTFKDNFTLADSLLSNNDGYVSAYSNSFSV